jgi:hypothetical protein
MRHATEVGMARLPLRIEFGGHPIIVRFGGHVSDFFRDLDSPNR